MAKVNITLYGKDYAVNCGEGEEARLQSIVDYVEGKIQAIASRAGNATDLRLMMLTCLMLADELMEARRQTQNDVLQEEDLILAAVNHLKDRVANIASQIGRA